jgi:predicted nucleic acid-binding protein
MGIFLDASYWLALTNETDFHHKRAAALAVQIASHDFGNSATSDFIFDEAVTVMLRKLGHKEAVALGHLIMDSEAVFYRIDDHLFQAAWQAFTNQTLGLSFTDCTNLAAMRSLGIEQIATFDQAFKKIKGVVVVD